MSKSGGLSSPPDIPEAIQSPRSRLVLVRHGESTWNQEGRIQGQLDPPLSRLGREQAQLLAQRLCRQRWAGVYVSDLARALETVAPLAGAAAVEPLPMAELREVDLGQWQGLQRQQLVERFPVEWEAWTKRPSWDIVPGGEGMSRFEQRVKTVLGQLQARHPEGDILVVTHGGVIQVALLDAVGRGSNGLFPFTIANASVSILERTERGPRISSVNDTCHLD